MSIGGCKPPASSAAGDSRGGMIADKKDKKTRAVRNARVGFCVELDDAILDEVAEADESVLKFHEEREATQLLKQDSGHLTEASYDLAWDRDRGWSRNRVLNFTESDHSLPLDDLNAPLKGGLSDSMLEEISGIGDFAQHSFEIDELNISNEFFDYTTTVPNSPPASCPSGARGNRNKTSTKPDHSDSQDRLSPGLSQDNSPLMEELKCYRRFGAKKQPNELLASSSGSLSQMCSSKPRMTLSDISLDLEQEELALAYHQNKERDDIEEDTRSTTDSRVGVLGELLQSLRVNNGVV